MGKHKYGYSNATFAPAKKRDRDDSPELEHDEKDGNEGEGDSRESPDGDEGEDQEGS